MRGFPIGTTFQVTDLARNHREVVDRARHGGALIRDKDGTALLLAPAADAARDRDLADLAAAFLRLRTTMDLPPEQRTAAGYGAFAWLGVIAEEHQREFIAEVTEPILVALSGGSLQPATDIIEDWRVTSATYADEDLRGELSRPLPRPLHNVEL